MKRKNTVMVGKGRLTAQERELNEAIDRVYRKYGTDLTRFFEEVYREASTKHQGYGGKRDSSQREV